MKIIEKTIFLETVELRGSLYFKYFFIEMGNGGKMLITLKQIKQSS